MLATLPDGFIQREIVSDLTRPTDFEFGPGGKIYVSEQATGLIRVVEDGQIRPAPLLDLDVSTGGERGLGGFLLGPPADHGHGAHDHVEHDHEAQYLYTYYTANTSPARNRLSRFPLDEAGEVAGPEEILLELDPIPDDHLFHNGGGLAWGDDGKLYVGVGDHLRPQDAQDLSTPVGKVLRINADGSIPEDNPYYSQLQGINRSIWASGLRNPFNLHNDPVAGGLLIFDVGEATWEEVNLGVAGANYGWPLTEGPTDDLRFSGPLYSYRHDGGPVGGCAIIGGASYPAGAGLFPGEYASSFYVADYCNGILRIDPATGTISPFVSDIGSTLVDLHIADDGSFYYLSFARGDQYGIEPDTGTIIRVEYQGSGEPAISRQPRAQVAPLGGSATFSVVAAGAPPYSYQWQRNGVDIPGATDSALTLDALTLEDDAASFRVVISNDHGQVTSDDASLSVLPFSAPTIQFLSPGPADRYNAGDQLAFEAIATDGLGDALPPGAFTWWIEFHHDQHSHPFLAQTHGIASGSVAIPTAGETSDNVWFRIHVRVADGHGLVSETSRDVFPNKAEVTMRTSPEGLGLTLDGRPVASPSTFVGVVGLLRSLGAPESQEVDGVPWVFDSWSSGHRSDVPVATPAVDSTFTAVYRIDAGTVGDGKGFAASYFDEDGQAVPTFRSIDPTVAFDWHGHAPAGLADDGAFGARWEGDLIPQFDEPYTFRVVADGGARLWVDGRLVLDGWDAEGPSSTESEPITLEAGRPVAVRLDYRQSSGDARAELLWSSPSTPPSIVPSRQVVPASFPSEEPKPSPGPGPDHEPAPNQPTDWLPQPGRDFFDLDGDGKADLLVFDPDTATWVITLADGRVERRQFGAAGDVAVPGDYDGDGRTDLAVFRPRSDLVPGASHWFVSLSGGGAIDQPFGAVGDSAVPGDYDGDGRADLAVFRTRSDLIPGASHWFLTLSGGGAIDRPFGADGDLAAAVDFDGDRVTDLAVFRPRSDLVPGASHWFATLSGGGTIDRPFGASGDVAVPGDYDGDGRADLAVFRPRSDLISGASHWFSTLSGGGALARILGEPGDVPAPGDHDGDGITDLAVTRPSSAEAVLQRSRDRALRLAFDDLGPRARLISTRWAWLEPDGGGDA